MILRDVLRAQHKPDFNKTIENHLSMSAAETRQNHAVIVFIPPQKSALLQKRGEMHSLEYRTPCLVSTGFQLATSYTRKPSSWIKKGK